MLTNGFVFCMHVFAYSVAIYSVSYYYYYIRVYCAILFIANFAIYLFILLRLPIQRKMLVVITLADVMLTCVLLRKYFPSRAK